MHESKLNDLANVCRLIQSGPYALIRHPSYTGTMLLFAGASYFAGLRSMRMLAPFMFIITTGFCKLPFTIDRLRLILKLCFAIQGDS